MNGVSLQAAEAYQRLGRLQNLRTGFQARLEHERSSARLNQAVDRFFEHPIMSINQLADLLQVPYKTAQRTMNRLEKLGIVREVTRQLRNRLYRADGILRELTSP